MNLLTKFTIKQKLYFTAFASILGFVIYLACNVYVELENKQRLSSLGNNLYPILETAQTNEFILFRLSEMLNNAAAMGEEDLVEEAGELAKEMNASFDEIEQLDISIEEKVEQLRQYFNDYFLSTKEMTEKFIEDDESVEKQYIADVSKKLPKIKEELKSFRDFSYERFQNTIKKSNEASHQATIIGTILALIVISTLILSIIIARIIANSLQSTVIMAEKISAGDFASDETNEPISLESSNDETTKLISAFHVMRENLKRRKEEDSVKSIAAARNNAALDTVTAGVMMADENMQIVYANEAAIAVFTAAERDIKTEFAAFNAKEIVNAKIDIFFSEPDSQCKKIKALKTTDTSQILMGGRTFSMTTTPVWDVNNERVGTVIEWNDLTHSLKEQAEEKIRLDKERMIAAENMRIKISLDAVTAQVMIADVNNDIIYTNEALNNMMKAAEQDIQKELSSFSADNILGEHMDVFHKESTHQQDIIKHLKETIAFDIEVGGRTFHLVATAVLDEKGERLGTAIEWQDRTAILAQAVEEKRLADAAQILANENARVKISLDAVTAQVMIADANNKIIYTNAALNNMMKEAEFDIKRELPKFNAANILGEHMDVFHKNPAHQQNMMKELKGTIEVNIEVGGRTFNLVATAVLDEKGERLGTAIEWQDKTAILAQAVEEKRLADAAQILANENARVKISLDAVSANVMIADDKHNIVYMNTSLNHMFSNAQMDIKQVLPNFDSTKLLGASMDQFHKNPANQTSMINKLIGTHKTEIKVGPRTFSLVVNAVLNKKKERIGTAVEWTDRTNELAVEQEVADIVKAAVNGDLSRRIDMQDKDGFFKVVSGGINQLTEICDNVLKDTIRVLGAMAQGNLTENITADYKGDFNQLKNDANATTEKFIEVIAEIQKTSNSVYTGSSEISVGNASLSTRTEQQASSLEETASSMEEMTSTIKQSADNARQANQLASGARDLAEKGGEVVKNAVKAMEEINSSSKRVADIISVIDEIAFQTNLLALNAAVEAAQAGEQGRGFAVVADEVRNLAQRSATAAQEIKGLIGDSVEKVDEGSKLVNDTGDTLGEIVSSVKKVSDIIAEIAAATLEQSTGIDQVNIAVGQLDEMTQQNAALVEEASATSEAMSGQAKNLNTLMDFFNTGK